MGSTINPLFQNFIAGQNPTGNQIALPGVQQTNTQGANPLLPKTNLSPNVAGSGNPYDVVPATPGAAPATAPPNFPANTGPYTSTGAGPLNAAPGSPGSTMFGFPTGDKQQHQLWTDLKNAYGPGMAGMIFNFLQGGAGYNQQAISNLLASLQPGIQRGEEDLMSQFSASGNRFGSGAQIGLGDYLSRVNLNEGELITQMYEQALTNYMDVMMGSATKTSPGPSIWDKIMGGLGLAGSGASGASAAITASNPNANTGVLDTIAGALAGF
jgi:hypothetical protein